MRARSVWWTLVAGLTLANGAAAQDVKPTVAPAPLELRRRPEAISKKDADQLSEEFDRLVRAAGARIPTPSEMASALTALKRQDFAASDEALAQLAQKAQTLYAVHVQLDYPVTGTVVGVGKVVRADGKRMNQEIRLERSREMRTYLQATTETVIAVLEKLELQRLPSSLPVVTPEPAKPEPVVEVKPDPGAPPSPPPLVVQGIRPSLLAGRVLAFGGGALALGGIVALGLASADNGQFSPSSAGYLPERQIGLYRDAKLKETTGGVLVAVGAAVALGGGALMLLSSGDDAQVSVTVAPGPGGVMAALGGSF